MDMDIEGAVLVDRRGWSMNGGTRESGWFGIKVSM